MASTTATRVWRVYKAAGKEWPQLDDDELIDFMVMEAVAVKVTKEDAEQAKTDEKREWKKDKEGLDNLRSIKTTAQ